MGVNASVSYLGGDIVVETLGDRTELDLRFRGGDSRGEVAMVVSGGAVEHLELAEFAHAGVRRAFHAHRKYEEMLYVVRGGLRIVAECVGDPETRQEFTVHAGDLVTIKPGVAHAYLSTEPSLVISMGSGADPFDDRQVCSSLEFSG